jgi:hypothetical protein
MLSHFKGTFDDMEKGKGTREKGIIHWEYQELRQSCYRVIFLTIGHYFPSKNGLLAGSIKCQN